MAHFKFGIYLILAFAFNWVKCFDEAADLNVKVTIQNLTTFLNENSEIKELFPLVKEQVSHDPTSLSKLTYSAGERVDGDQLVATVSESYSWNTSGDRRLVITYPRAGAGALITYIQIVVEQSTPHGKAAITKGGLGLRYIEFYIDAYQTNYMNYTVEIYGFY
ncbi:uncharacterized protein LOC129566526 [Sitodiplosis mosellana]|uniref:uncharacterized protein LOC129566526 n=1 Tax=Sitodiplosis mosellana TaxID=263140 RepID=UPI002444CE40|nr:uncharacterized protein LOC129566526 [Sitodiplosis mosellana]